MLISASNVPIVVGLIAAASGWLVLEYGVYTADFSREVLVSPFYYVTTLFLHRGWAEYVASMYFFVPAGVSLTYMTSNKNVLAVVFGSHAFAALVSGFWMGLAVTGTAAAAYGLLSATMVRAARIYAEGFSSMTRMLAPAGLLVVATFGLLSVTESAVYSPVLMGFVFGGSFEGTRAILGKGSSRGVGSGTSERKDGTGFIHER